MTCNRRHPHYRHWQSARIRAGATKLLWTAGGALAWLLLWSGVLWWCGVLY